MNSYQPPVDHVSVLVQAGYCDDVVREALTAYHRSYALYLGCDVSESSAGSLVSAPFVPEPGTDVSGGSSISTGRAQARRRWRNNKKTKMARAASQASSAVSFGVESGRLLGGRVDGCYNDLLVREEVGSKKMSTFRELLARPRSDLRLEHELECKRICRVAPGVYHVASVGVGVLDTLQSVAVKGDWPARSIGSWASGLTPTEALSTTPDLDDSLGALVNSEPVATHVMMLTKVDFAVLDGVVKTLQANPEITVCLMLPAVGVFTDLVPYGRYRDAVYTELQSVCSGEREIGRVMACLGRMPEYVDRLSSGVRALLRHNYGVLEDRSQDREKGWCAARYAVQSILFALGVPADRCFLSHNDLCLPEEKSASLLSPELMSFSQVGAGDWSDYLNLSEAAASELWLQGERGVRCLRLKRKLKVMQDRLSRGAVVLPRMQLDDVRSGPVPRLASYGVTDAFVRFRDLEVTSAVMHGDNGIVSSAVTDVCGFRVHPSRMTQEFFIAALLSRDEEALRSHDYASVYGATFLAGYASFLGAGHVARELMVGLFRGDLRTTIEEGLSAE